MQFRHPDPCGVIDISGEAGVEGHIAHQQKQRHRHDGEGGDKGKRLQRGISEGRPETTLEIKCFAFGPADCKDHADKADDGHAKGDGHSKGHEKQHRTQAEHT